MRTKRASKRAALEPFAVVETLDARRSRRISPARKDGGIPGSDLMLRPGVPITVDEIGMAEHALRSHKLVTPETDEVQRHDYVTGWAVAKS